MYTCKESTSEALFDMIDQTLFQFDISWKNCVAISLDNTFVNLGRKNSTMTRILNFNFAIYINGCPCHVLHNIGGKASEKFTEVAGFDVEDVLVDIYLPIQRQRLINFLSKCTSVICQFQLILTTIRFINFKFTFAFPSTTCL